MKTVKYIKQSNVLDQVVIAALAFQKQKYTECTKTMPQFVLNLKTNIKYLNPWLFKTSVSNCEENERYILLCKMNRAGVPE